MKTHVLSTLAMTFILTLNTSVFASIPTQIGGEPDVKIIVGEKKIWLVGDETPVAKFTVSILDANGSTVGEKEISSKTVDWSLDVSCLPKGHYSVRIGKLEVASFSR